jgi:hypothetical protein
MIRQLVVQATKVFLTGAMVLSLNTQAHVGGHGDVKEGGKFGGVTAPVIDQKEEEQAGKATVLYIAELVRAENGSLSFYLFDTKMNLLDLSQFGDKIQAKLEFKKKGKFEHFGEFTLSKEGKRFTGALPKVELKPFNIDFYLEGGKGAKAQKLFVGFANLD